MSVITKMKEQQIKMQGKSVSIDLEKQLEKIIKGTRRYFWDKGPLSPQRDKYVIIERVLEFGSEDEVDIILNYYGTESIKEVVRESRELSPRTVNYFVLLLRLSRRETRCFSDVSPRIWQPY
ncbi:MAG: hypothetical protein JRJ38_17835 [Deltaproteobacteria bacterium]|nr:hypothetical protein [Deltaproteobacteria bacterium]